jgi:hypothetical protein
MHGTTIGTCGGGIPSELSKVHRIALKDISITASSEQWDAVIGASTVWNYKTKSSKIQLWRPFHPLINLGLWLWHQDGVRDDEHSLLRLVIVNRRNPYQGRLVPRPR